MGVCVKWKWNFCSDTHDFPFSPLRVHVIRKKSHGPAHPGSPAPTKRRKEEKKKREIGTVKGKMERWSGRCVSVVIPFLERVHVYLCHTEVQQHIVYVCVWIRTQRLIYPHVFRVSLILS